MQALRDDREPDDPRISSPEPGWEWVSDIHVGQAATTPQTCGYTLATGRMQAVLLHAGAGLLQGAMGIHGAFVTGVPMVVISGESMTYGEQPEFDPGAQWINNLSIVGGTTNLVDSIVKYASVAGSAYTLYESVIRAGELAQRQPTGPTYLSVSTETLMDAWTPPANPRTVPSAPRVLTAREDIEKLAAQISKAKRPVAKSATRAMRSAVQENIRLVA